LGRWSSTITSQVAVNSILLMLKHKGAGPEDMLELRMMLECQAASFSAQRATDDDIASIAGTIDAMRAQPRSRAEKCPTRLRLSILPSPMPRTTLCW
jgi:DNA-binding FadR family transcriptional regulator